MFGNSVKTDKKLAQLLIRTIKVSCPAFAKATADTVVTVFAICSSTRDWTTKGDKP